jgi:hypothetical protein
MNSCTIISSSLPSRQSDEHLASGVILSRWRRPLFWVKQRPPVEGVVAVSMDGG